MNISNETLSIISNFASINQNIHIAAGNEIKTKSPSTLSLYATAKVVEDFPVDFSIYELSKFLNILNLFDTPEVEFHEGHLSVKKDKSTANFAYTNTSLVDAITDYKKEVKSPEPLIRFTLNESTFKTIKQSAKLFDVSDINVSSLSDGMIRITASGAALSKENANKFTVDIPAPDTYQDDVSVNIKLDILKFLPGDYNASIAIIDLQDRRVAMCRFVNTSLVNSSVEYIVGAEIL